MVKDYYKILDVSKSSSNQEIRNAYLRLAKIYHPDVSSEADAEIRFKEINEAYHALKDPDLRLDYEASFESVEKFEKDFAARLEGLNLFKRYVDFMTQYRASRKIYFDGRITDYFSNYVEVDIFPEDFMRSNFKAGLIVSIRIKGLAVDGLAIEEMSAQGVIWKVRPNHITIELINHKKANLYKGGSARVRIDEDTRMFYDNISHCFDKIIDNPFKFKKFKNLITDIYTSGVSFLGLGTLGISELTGGEQLDFFCSLNPEQEEFVKKGLELVFSQNSYVLGLTGPGGTGKTYCIVELIRQLLKQDNKIRILVTSFTNVAVDNVVQMLIQTDPTLKKNVLRFAHPNRIKIRDKNILEISIEKKNTFGKNYSEIIKENNVIGVTLDRLGSGIFDLDDFDVAICDECSMIEFSKLIIAISKCKKVILVGDEQQLEPFLDDDVWKYLRDKGMKDEEIEKVISPFFADLIGYLRKTKSSSFVQLKSQHRSYEDIIRYPNKQFYDNRLITEIQPDFLRKYDFISKVRFENSLLKDTMNPGKVVVWLDTETLPEVYRYSSDKDDKLYNKDYIGKRRYFHLAQAAFTCIILEKYLKELFVKYGGDTSYRNKIGIISPYNDQVELIRNYIFDYPDIDPYYRETISSKRDSFEKSFETLNRFTLVNSMEVGTVHKFQGREKDIILFNITSYTGVGNPKLLKDKKLLNVAITRARCKLIFIGAISGDLPYYSEFLSDRYVHIVGIVPKVLNNKKEKIRELFLAGEINGSYVGTDINEYLREGELNKRFFELIGKLAKIEDVLITKKEIEGSLTESEEEDKEIENILDMIKFEELKKTLFKNIEKFGFDEYFEKVFSVFKQVATNYFYNNVLDQYSLEIFKKDVRVLAESDFPRYIADLAQIDLIKVNIEKKEQYESFLKDNKFGNMLRDILESIVGSIKIEIERQEYVTSLEKEISISLSEVSSVISPELAEEVRERLINKVELMDKKLFVAYGKGLCKNLINGKDIRDLEAKEWFEKLVETPPEGFDLEVWLYLRWVYDTQLRDFWNTEIS